MPPTEQALWVLVIEGAPEFSFSVSGNPPVVHSRGSSIHHLVLTVQEAEEISRVLEGTGLETVLTRVPGQTLEQALERTRLLDQDRVWPCGQCPMCPWLDPLTEDYPCGIKAWPPESVRILRESSDLHRDAEAACPVLNPERTP